MQWKVKEFYDKVDAVDPTLRPKIEECVDDANKHYYSHISKRRRTRSPEVKSQKASGPIPLSEDRRKKAKSVPPSPPQPPHKHKRRKHS